MPIRSPRGRATAYRALWQWPLRSPARLAVTVVAAVAVAVGVSLAATAVGGPSENDGLAAGLARPTAGAVPRASGSRASAARTPTALAPVPDLTPTTRPTSQAPAAALDVAARWSAAWVRPPAGATAQQWLDGLRATTTEEYLGVLGAVEPANIPATRVTGDPRPVRVAARSVQVEVPTDALTLVVLVVDTETGWRVAGYDRV